MTIKLVSEEGFDQQSQWRILKYEIRTFFIRYSKIIAKEGLEGNPKILEKTLSCDKNIEENHKCTADLDESYGNIAE